MDQESPILKRSRGYLPHWEHEQGPYFVTFRLAGSLPANVVKAIEDERQEALERLRLRGIPVSPDEAAAVTRTVSERIDFHLDSGGGTCHLRDEKAAGLVVDALRHFDGSRYCLHAWCVMPNHVHVVLTTFPRPDGPPPPTPDPKPLAGILHSWKSYTSKRINAMLGRTGALWQREYHDHLIRNDREFHRCVDYTVRNPVKAGLCREWDEWPWSGIGLVDAEQLASILEGKAP